MVVQLYDVPVKIKETLPSRFERKHYLAPRNVGMAYSMLRHICLPASDYPSEQINSLYFDTPNLDQHERSDSGDFQKDKVRIRWYGADNNITGMQTIFIELKSRRGYAGTKQRFKLSVPAESLALDSMASGIISHSLLMKTLAGFSYFPREILWPVIKISYWRYRFGEIITGQRVSLDCRIRSTMVMPGYGNGQKGLELPGAVIEIKGTSMELPLTLRHLSMLDTDWTRFSKYSTCIDSHAERPGTVGFLSPSGRIIQQ